MAAKLEESNIALLGSDLEKEVRKAAAEYEAEWKGCGAAPGIEVWRVEKLGIKKWPKKQYGSFYSGDSYIVLHTYKKSEDAKKLSYNIHFWLGKNTSQDEAGVAAYKTVELDDKLGTIPVQFREVMGNESEEFLALFKPTIKIMEGGIDSGFNIVTPETYKPRLLQVKGKKNVRVSEVELSSKSLNHGDVFILDNGLEIVVWNGEESGIKEKRKAQEVVEDLKESRGGKPETSFISGSEDHASFWKILGDKSKIQSALKGGDDDKVEAYVNKLFRISGNTGKLKVDEVASGKFGKSQLTTDDVYIVDTEAIIYVWIGNDASKDEKSLAFKIANEYLVKSGRSFATPIVRIVQGTENDGFEDAFDKSIGGEPVVKKGSGAAGRSGAGAAAGSSPGCCSIL